MSFVLILLAGLINGSYPLPLRLAKNSHINYIWCIYSLLGFAVLPWIILLFILPMPVSLYSHLGLTAIITLIIGGLLFGIGQFCFAIAVEKIGIALAFSINLSIGTCIGSLFTIFYKGVAFSLQNLSVVIAILLIIISLINYYFTGKIENNNNNNKTPAYILGWLVALFAGIATGVQNITFILVLHSQPTLETLNSFWVWPPFLSIASIPMVIGFYYLAKNNTVTKIKLKFFDGVIALMMGVLFASSLWLYSSGITHLTVSQHAIAWPLFMIAIILTSQYWGIIYKEFDLKKISSRLKLLLSTVLLITAIIILAIGM